MGISRILSTASRVRAWTQPHSASFSQTIALTSPVGKKVKQETLVRKRMAETGKGWRCQNIPGAYLFWEMQWATTLYPLLQEEELARKKSAAYSKKDEPIHLPFNAVFEDEVDQLYAEVEERRRAMAQANVSRSFYGNTPGVKWGPPINNNYNNRT